MLKIRPCNGREEHGDTSSLSFRGESLIQFTWNLGYAFSDARCFADTRHSLNAHNCCNAYWLTPDARYNISRTYPTSSRIRW